MDTTCYPLDRFPSSKAIEQRLEAIAAETEKLRILLRVAKELEAVDPNRSDHRWDKGRLADES